MTEHRLAAAPEEAERPLKTRRLAFAIVAVGLFMSSMDQTVVATALPAFQRDLDAALNWSGWTITVYALGQVLAMPIAGRLSDQVGRKKVFLIAVGVFTLTSLCCALAPNIYVLVFFRALQGLGGGAMIPSATGIVSDEFRRDRDRAVGMFTSIFPIGGIVGPIIGGAFVTYTSWRVIFLVNVPIGVALLFLGIKFISATPRKPAPAIDYSGIALLGSLLLLAMFGFAHLGSPGSQVTDPLFIGTELAAVALAALSVRHSIRHRSPFIPIRLLRGRTFGAMNALNFVFGGAALGFGALVPLYAQQRFDIDALASGTLLTARAVGMICVAGLTVLALRRTGHRVPMAVGLLVVATGLILMSMPPQEMSAYVWLAVAAGVTGLGMGCFVPAANNAGLHLAGDELAASAGLRGMFRMAGLIVAVSLTTAMLSRSGDPGLTQAHGFLLCAVLLLVSLPLVLSPPDHRGRW
ncbi:MAG: MFS transporter [Geodermatophilaceae bacterium]|nr:MFS transporter [Geodermatophilaceae bacterium]